MVFSKSDVARVAKLARMSLTPEDLEKLRQDLERIISFVDQLNQVDIDGIVPMSHAGNRALSLRDDEAQPTLGRACIESSVGYEDGLVRVPKIIE